MNRRVALVFFGLSLLAIGAPPPNAVDVSSQVTINQNGFARNRSTGFWTATITVTNSSASAIKGPIQVLLTNLSQNATMVNNSGTSSGSPFVTVSTAALAPGASANAMIQFSNPTGGFINFTRVTYSGGL